MGLRIVLNLNHALEETGADLRITEVPDARWKTAEGRFLLGILAHAAQFQGDYDSKRMTDMARSTFERGGHLGNDPFGYRTVRDGLGQVAKPRTLEIVEAEAAVVRRVFALIAGKSCAEVARLLQREGVKRRAEAPWTKDAVKDIIRRGRVYLGNVVYRRGHDPCRSGGRDRCEADGAALLRGQVDFAYGAPGRTRGRSRQTA